MRRDVNKYRTGSKRHPAPGTWNSAPHVHLSYEVCYYSRMTLRSAFKFAAGVALALVAAITGSGQTQGELTAGDEAPAFDLPGSDGKTYRLADFKGKSTVVLAWFPKAFTGG